jgi:hypothetical protein
MRCGFDPEFSNCIRDSTNMGARNLFDEIYTWEERESRCILDITVHLVYYPITEDILL